MVISANEVKTRGVSIFGEMLEKFDELTINVRRKICKILKMKQSQSLLRQIEGF
jgi:hypothetical protein